MLHSFKTPTAIAACLVIAAACSSGTSSEFNAALTADPAASNAIASNALSQKASPVDLAILAALAKPADATETTVAQTLPNGKMPTEARIVPATSVTYSSEAPVLLDSDAEYSSESLLVVPHDSNLLEGTVYDSEAESTLRKPAMTPGTYRTVEYKN